MSDEVATNYVPQERAAVITYYLVMGEALTTEQLAQITCMSTRGARYVMDRLSRVVPVYRGDDGKWRMCK